MWQLITAMLMTLLPWLSVVGVNVSTSVLLTTGVTAIALCLPATVQPLPAWIHLLLLPLWHQLQLVSHRFYRGQRDMSEFAERYRKGWRLSLLLAVYELPILVQFFLNSLRGDLRERQRS